MPLLVDELDSDYYEAGIEETSFEFEDEQDRDNPRPIGR